MYDLIQYPDHIEPLREEWKRILAEQNGEFNKNTLSKLEKLDSFLKESQRHKPTGSSKLSFSSPARRPFHPAFCTRVLLTK